MDEPIDLAQKAAERGDPWFGLGNLLSETTTSNAALPPVTVESLEAIFKQFPPMDVSLPPVDFVNIFNHTFTPELTRSIPTASMFSELGWWSIDLKGHLTWAANRKTYFQIMSKARRAERWRKIRKRQRRAAQRRHERGE